MSSPFPTSLNKINHIKSKTIRLILRILVFGLVGISVACSFPGFSNRLISKAPGSETTTPSAPTATPQSLPPALLESDPPLGSLLPLDKPITLYFSQPMQRTSVEKALSGDPALIGNVSWSDDATLVLSPKASLIPDSDININIGVDAVAANGRALPEPIQLNFRTVSYLALAQSLPEPDAEEIDPTSAVVASFNQPVIALSAAPEDLPKAFTLSASGETSVKGKGEWLNTATYIFYPDPALQGGKRYTVSLNPQLKSTAGSVLESALGWSFSTATPRLVSSSPENGFATAPLDSPVVLEFSQPMDSASVQAGFQLLDADKKAVEGNFSWDESGKVMTYTLSSLLDRDIDYSVLLSADVTAQGGTPLGSALESQFHTLPFLRVTGHDTIANAGLVITMSAPIRDDLEGELKNFVSITPPLQNFNISTSEYFDIANNYYLHVSGDFQYETSYHLSISPDLPDRWGGKLGREFIYDFRTASASPNLVQLTSTEVFLTPQDSGIPVMVTNLPGVNLTGGNVSVNDFIKMMGDNGYDFRQTYASADQQSWKQSFNLERNVSQQVALNISPNNNPLNPGLYYLNAQSDELTPTTYKYLLIVSNIHLTFKISATDVLVWAVDLRTNAPVAGTAITLYDTGGITLAAGQTDESGIFTSAIPEQTSLYSNYIAVAGNPGDDSFAVALSTWDTGISSGEFDIDASYQPPHLESYIYTDRPIYRPGQTVDFRAIVRQAYNGRYTMPDFSTTQGKLPITVYGELGQELNKLDLTVSAFGSAHGEYIIPSGATPGYYRIACDLTDENDVIFQVANYRKPEINLQVDFTEDQALSGKTVKANIFARYFFDAPAGNTSLHWALYSSGAPFYINGYQVGSEDSDWLESYPNYYAYSGLGEIIAEGDAQTQADGTLTLDLPTDVSKFTEKLTLEATITDESGFPVSGRGSMTLHPARFYTGIHPQSWIGKAGDQLGFDIQTVDWLKSPSGPHNLKAVFQKVTWVKNENAENEIFFDMAYSEQYTPIGSADFKVDDQGMARLSFTPPEAGVYKLDVSGEGAITSIYLWVGGPSQAVWPDLPNQRIRLTADKDAYRPGETAHVFIPNPFGSTAQALVTIERSIIIRRQVVTVEPGGSTVDLPLSDEDAPNVYVSVTLLGVNAQSKPDFRQGYLNLPVAPEAEQLAVSITGDPQKAGPGDAVSLNVQVKDPKGNPAQGEFSLSVVDQAVLALADPNSVDILSAYYGVQPISVRTGLGMTVYAQRNYIYPGDFGGGGGGGEEAASIVRENFPDTAFWSADLVTDGNGNAQVNMTLPDNLTTWQVDLRGLTVDTRVGEAETHIVASKELLLRPAAQRFFVRGDHARLLTVVQNNTANELSASITLDAAGIILDDPSQATQQMTIPANGRAAVNWWGVVQGVESVSLTYSAQAGEYQDSIRVQNGAIPVRAYATPQTFSTSGILDQAVDRVELVSLPHDVMNTTEGGSLKVELSTSLAGVIGDALDVLEFYPYECTEQTVSRFLPNLESYVAFQKLSLDSPELKARLERTLEEGLSLLYSRQNEDGGWAWWQGGESNPYISSYVLIGLVRAQQAGFTIDPNKLQKGTEYLLSSLAPPSMLGEPWLLDRLAFEHYALTLAGAGSLAGIQVLYAVRDNLDPWAKAYLALSLEYLTPGSPEAKTLLSDLESTAIRSATGAHWEETHIDGHNMQSTIGTSAIVLYALATVQPQSPLVDEATRYLSAHRGANGAWDSTYSTAWTIMALTQVMSQTGEVRSDFSYAALLNNAPFASGETNAESLFVPVIADTPLANLYPNSPNALTIRRSPGLGKLYYRANLQVFRPVENAPALNQGVSLDRVYYLADQTCTNPDCPIIQEASVGQKVDVHLILTIPNDTYYLVLEDYIPAGAEILDTSLKTSQQGTDTVEAMKYESENISKWGWGWWYFETPKIYDDHIAWAVDYLPAGSYELTYTLVTLQPGEYRVLPAHAWEFYFPEVQGASAGEVFTIK